MLTTTTPKNARAREQRFDPVSPDSVSIRPVKGSGNGAKIYFFGHFGSDNFGNEITFQTIVYQIRRRLPEAELACICTQPRVLRESQKINAIPISRDFGGPTSHTGLARLLRRTFIGVPREIFRWFEAFRTLRGADMLVIPGTGLLTDAYGLQNWGPYNLFKWSLMAKLRGAKILFISVGAGPLYGWLGKSLVKSALFMADFRSYRDETSMSWLKAIGVRTNSDRIDPDLVFSLPETAVPNNRTVENRRRVVGLGLMSYAGKYSVAEPSDAIYQQYLETLVVFAKWLLEHDYDIRLLIGDAADKPVTQEFKALLSKRLVGNNEERIIDEPVHSVEQLLSQIGAADIVVATRFHNILLALVLNKPVIAISFHHKCASLMKQMGLAEYTHDINNMNAQRLIEQFMGLENNSERLKPIIREEAERSRKALEERYNFIFKAQPSQFPAKP